MSYSWLDRLHHVVNGLGGALEAPFGFVNDLAKGAFTDDEHDGIVGRLFQMMTLPSRALLNTAQSVGTISPLYHAVVDRGAQLAQSTFSPNTGLGAAIGGLPDIARVPGRYTLAPALRQSERAYHDISQGLSTALYASSIATSRGSGPLQVTGIPQLLAPSTWREAYQMAQQNADPGQAVALAFLTKDIHNPTELARAMNSDAFHVASGVGDAVFRTFLDPTILAGHAVTGLRTARVIRPLDSPEAVAAAVDSARVAKFNDALGSAISTHGSNASSYIRDRWFSAPEYQSSGGIISDLLASAPSATDRFHTLRALMGDKQSLARLSEHDPTLAGPIDRLTRPLSESPLIRDSIPYNASPVELEGISHAPGTLLISDLQSELDALYPDSQRAARVESMAGTIVRSPRVTEGAISSAITRSELWQTSPLAAPLRLITQMTPHRMIDLSDPASDIQLHRWLQGAGQYLDIPTRDSLRSAYQTAITPAERQLILTQAEERVISSLASSHNMTPSDIYILTDGANDGRNATRDLITNSRTFDAKGRSTIRFLGEDGTPVEIPLPMWSTQQTQYHVLPDLNQLERATTSLGRFNLLHPSTSFPSELLDTFYRIWKPSVLLRFGWPIRVIGDEQLRIMAKIGALSQARALARTVPSELSASVRHLSDWVGNRLNHSPASEVGPNAYRPVVNRGLTINGYDVEGAFGAPGDVAGIFRDYASSNSTFRAMLGPIEDAHLADLRLASANNRSVHPWEEGHSAAWESAVNEQIGRDTFGRLFLRGATADDAVKWLLTDPEGRSYAAAHPIRARDVRSWAEINYEQVHELLPTPELRARALRGSAFAFDLSKTIPDASARPSVHGAIVMQNLDRGHISAFMNRTVTNLFSTLGAAPTNLLSRIPYFDHAYRAEATRLVSILDDKALTSETLSRISDHARTYALDSQRDLLYDLAEQSRLGAVLKHISPFFNAWQEVLTRWTGLAVENPAFVARLRLLWRAPEAAGILTDENGREVKDATGPLGRDRYITIPLPEWAHNIPGLRSQGSIAFNRKSFNMALAGAPGFGPPVQILANEVVKNRPDLESSLSFILPYGSTQDIKDLLLPATARRAWSAAAGEEDRAFLNTKMRIYLDKVVDANLNHQQPDSRALWDQADSEATSLYKLRTAAAWFSPAAPNFRSLYQLFIDAYRQARERYASDKNSLGGKDPDEWFYDTYGSAYFPLTQSLTKSVNGIPATLSGYAASKRYADLISQHPDLGSLIVGSEGAGKFASAVYDAQLASGSRTAFTGPEIQTAPETRVGWLEYGRVADLLDAQLHQRGLTSLNVKEATDLRATRSAMILYLAQKYPSWYDDYQQSDEGKWRKRIAVLSDITDSAKYPELNQRPDISGLHDYLTLRKLLISTLAQRGNQKGGSLTLTAKSNADLAYAWSATVSTLTERNLPFASLYHRWLENDPVTPTIFEKAAA